MTSHSNESALNPMGGFFYWSHFIHDILDGWSVVSATNPQPDGCTVYVDSHMALIGSCFMVTWIILKKSPLGDRPNTELRDHGTPNAHNRWFILFHHVWGPAWIKNFIEIAFGWGPGHIWLHTTLEDPWSHHMTLEVFCDGIYKLSFGLSQIIHIYGILTHRLFYDI